MLYHILLSVRLKGHLKLQPYNIKFTYGFNNKKNIRKRLDVWFKRLKYCRTFHSQLAINGRGRTRTPMTVSYAYKVYRFACLTWRFDWPRKFQCSPIILRVITMLGNRKEPIRLQFCYVWCIQFGAFDWAVIT